MLYIHSMSNEQNTTAMTTANNNNDKSYEVFAICDSIRFDVSTIEPGRGIYGSEGYRLGNKMMAFHTVSAAAYNRRAALIAKKLTKLGYEQGDRITCVLNK